MLRFACAAAISGALAVSATAAEMIATVPHPLPAPGGFALLPDQATLLVSQPKTAEIVSYNTLSEEETGRTTLDFKPGVMATDEESLFVAGEGTAMVYELDPHTFKVRRKFRLSGVGILDLAVQPKNRTLYASTTNYEVFAIDLTSGRVLKTDAVGNLVEVSPEDPGHVYTGVRRKDLREVFIIRWEGRGKPIRIIWDRWGSRSALLKYSLRGKKLTLQDVQDNATVNGFTMHLTPDAKAVMMTGGGGWRPPAEVGDGGGYYTAVFSTEDLQSMIGQGPHVFDMAFHPVLRLAAGNSHGRDIVLFDPKSYAEVGKIHVADGADERPLLMTFAAMGTKLAFWNGDNPKNPREGLHFIPLELSTEDRQLLTKRYGKLPEVAAKASSAAVPREEMTLPASAAVVPQPSQKEAGLEDPEDSPAGLLAYSGFNDQAGIGKQSRKNSPYPLGASGRPGGVAEKGWGGLWPAAEGARFQSETVHEGDGALELRGTVNLARRLARPLQGVVEIHQSVRVPAKGRFTWYLWQTNHADTGPMWGVRNGEIHIFKGSGNGSGDMVKTPARLPPDKWVEVTVRVNLPARKWKLQIPSLKYESPALGYRGNPQQLMAINFLCESDAGAFIDALRIEQAPADSPK